MGDSRDTSPTVPYTDDEGASSTRVSAGDVSSFVPYSDDPNERPVPVDEFVGTATGHSNKSSRKTGLCLFGTIVAVIAGLVSLAVLIAALAQPAPASSQAQAVKVATASNRKPKVKAVPYRLDFPALYPDITAEKDSGCFSAWSVLKSVPCHDQIFDRGNDNGSFRIMGPDSMYFNPRICDSRCKPALEVALQQLSVSCSASDTFILDGYEGMFRTSLLEAGPVQAVETLLKRNEHTCRKSPNGDSDFDYCTVEMFQRFNGLVDGMNAGNLQSIDTFTRQTDKSLREQGRRHRGSAGTNTYRYTYDYTTRAQTYGPGRGETSCGFCVFDFLNRTLNSWTEDAVISPDSKLPVSLPEFIRRVRKAGERCAPTQTWDKIYEDGIGQYRASGLLPEDWETSSPSGDLYYLIRNGPSRGDAPVSDIDARISSLGVSDNETKMCLSALAERYLSAPCYINVPLESLMEMLEEPESSTNIRSAYCSDSCTNAFARQPVQPFVEPRCAALPEARDFITEYETALQTRKTYCGLLSSSSQTSNCPSALKSLGRMEWFFTGRPSSTILLAELERGLDELSQKEVPAEIRPALGLGTSQSALTSSDARKTYREWSKDLGSNSICAGCIWAWLVGDSDSSEGAEKQLLAWMAQDGQDPAAYAAFVARYHSTCTSLGATWMGGVPYGDDPIVWRVQLQSGAVFRYLAAPEKGFHSHGQAYGVNEATGGVSIDRKMKANGPSLWHVLQAERRLRAMREGREMDWAREEEEHRKEADQKIWETDRWGSVRYIGPTGGLHKQG